MEIKKGSKGLCPLAGLGGAQGLDLLFAVYIMMMTKTAKHCGHKFIA
jgi:hypothetical protein